MIERTITRAQCNSNEDFERLIQIYTMLQGLMRPGSDAKHLLTVEELTVKDWTLIVELSPIGSRERPEVDQLCMWLQHLLTALKHWHALGYCHGYVSWRNVVLVPQDSYGYWVLIDMDQSHVPNRTVINWRHTHKGQTLCFQHDLYQLGELLSKFKSKLSEELECMRTLLLSAVDSPAITAEFVLSQLEDHHQSRSLHVRQSLNEFARDMNPRARQLTVVQ